MQRRGLWWVIAPTYIDNLPYPLMPQEMVLLDFLAAAWPVVVYVLLEGNALLEVLQQVHPGAFDILKADGGVTLVRRVAGRVGAAGGATHDAATAAGS